MHFFNVSSCVQTGGSNADIDFFFGEWIGKFWCVKKISDWNSQVSGSCNMFKGLWKNSTIKVNFFIFTIFSELKNCVIISMILPLRNERWHDPLLIYKQLKIKY